MTKNTIKVTNDKDSEHFCSLFVWEICLFFDLQLVALLLNEADMMNFCFMEDCILTVVLGLSIYLNIPSDPRWLLP